MAMADKESVDVEERAAHAFAGSLHIDEKVLIQAKGLSELQTVQDAASTVSRLPLEGRKAILQGLLTITVSDGKVKASECELIGALASYWEIPESDIQEVCLNSRPPFSRELEFES